MSVFARLSEPRRVVPRWREGSPSASQSDVIILETTRALELSERDLSDIRAHKIEWERFRTVGHAVDLLSSAIVQDNPEFAIDAANFLIANEAVAGAVGLDLAQQIVERVRSRSADGEVILGVGSADPADDFGPAHGRVANRIRSLRLRTHSDPHDALAWLDLALNYSRIGESVKSKRCVEIAVGLQPNHRHVLRSASRFYIHAGDLDVAHDILKRSKAVTADPWLMASEIACATVANRAPKYARHGVALLDSGKFSHRNTSELASALGTLEATSGSTRRAKKLIEASLRSPNDNTVAQAMWFSRQNVAIDVPETAWSVPRIYEAKASASYWAGNWDDAVRFGWQWLDDEPFSGRPVALATSIAAIALKQPKDAVKLAKLGVLANPDDGNLLNNLTFALAVDEQVHDARIQWQRARKHLSSEGDKVVWLANGGFISFLEGDGDVGNCAYELAVRRAHAARLHSLEAAALLYWAAARKRMASADMSAEERAHSKEFAERVFGGDNPPSIETLSIRASDIEGAHRDVDLRLARRWLAGADQGEKFGVQTKPPTERRMWRFEF